MTLLFSEEGLKRLDQIAIPGLLCAFDFDGTLAPIVARPENARLPESIRERLIALARFAPVAIITGRSVKDIRGRLGFEPDYVVGNHGLEGVPGWEAQAHQHEQACCSWSHAIKSTLKLDTSLAGVELEDKRFSLSVHYRMANDPHVEQKLRALFSSLDPAPRVVDGKFVFNLLMHDACDKGSALEELMTLSSARQAIYVGDDVTDEDAFRLQRPDLLSVRIEYSPHTAAAYYLKQLQDIMLLLDELTMRLRETGAENWLQPTAARQRFNAP